VTLLLSLGGVTKAYRGDAAPFALEVPEFDLAKGEALALAGPSGSGKSTLLMMLALALPPDEGVFTFSGQDMARLWRAGRRDALAGLRATMIGVVPQTGGLLPYLTVAGNIALTQRIAGCEDAARVRMMGDEPGIGPLLRTPSRTAQRDPACQAEGPAGIRLRHRGHPVR